MKITLCSIALLIAGVLYAKEVKFGDWTFGIHDKTGRLQTISCGDLLLHDNRAGKPDFYFSSPKMTSPDPEGYNCNPEKKEIVFKSRNGRWHYTDTYRINGSRLERTFQFVYKGRKTDKFGYLDLYWYLPAKGKFFFPLIFFNDHRSPEQMAQTGAYSRELTNGSLKDIPEKKVIANSPESRFAFFEIEPGKTLMVAMDGARDYNRSMIRRKGSIIQLMMYNRICGWLEPGIPQDLNKVTMEILPCSQEEALRIGPHKWFADNGQNVPADRPEWFLDNIMSVGMPAPSYSGSMNAQTAAKTLLPYLAKRGYNTYWLMPVSPAFTYMPDDYLDVRKELGDWNDLRAFTDEAHKNGLRVLLDIVPHGGAPAMAPKRGLSPWTLSIDEKGNFIRAMSYDYGSKEYRDYINFVCKEYFKKVDFDGFKVDQCGFSPPNWRLPNFPAKMPKSCPDPAWWENAVKANNGVLPRNETGRASDGYVYVGKLMADAIRKAVREAGKDKFMLAEDNRMPMAWSGDAAYNYRLACISWKIHQYSAEDFSSGFQQYLHDRQYTEPKGMIRHGGLDGHGHTPFVEIVGIDAYLALREAISWCRWSIMDTYTSIRGMGAHIARINRVKTGMAELRRGEAEYLRVSSEPKLFTVARFLPGQAAVGAANFRPEAVKSNIRFSLEDFSFKPNEEVQIFDVRTGEIFWKGTAKGFPGITLQMPRFGTRLLAIRRADAKRETFSESALTPAETVSSEAPQRDGEDFRIGSLIVSSATGLPKSFAGNLLNGGDIFDDRLPESGKVSAAIADGKIHAEFPNGMTIDYSANPDGRIKMEISSVCRELSRRQAVVLKSTTARRWMVNSAEGLLDEFHDPEMIEDNAPNFTHKFTLHPRNPVVFDSYRYPLLPGAAFTFADKNGKSIQIELADPQSDLYDNAMILESVPGDKSLHLAVFLTQTGPLSLAREGAARKVTLLLGTGAAAKSANHAKYGEYSFTNNSLYWSIRHPSCRMEISRIGGNVRNFFSETQKITGFDYGMPGKRKQMLASENMCQTVRLYNRDGVSHLRFAGMIGNPRSREVVWSAADYTFAKDGKVSVDCYLSGTGKVLKGYAKPQLFFTADGKKKSFAFGDIDQPGWTGLSVRLNEGTCSAAPELAFPEFTGEQYWNIGSVIGGRKIAAGLTSRTAGNDVLFDIISNGCPLNEGVPGMIVFQPCRLARLDMQIGIKPGIYDLTSEVDAEGKENSDCKLISRLTYRYTDKNGARKTKTENSVLKIPSKAGKYSIKKRVKIPEGASNLYGSLVLHNAEGGARKLVIRGPNLIPVSAQK